MSKETNDMPLKPPYFPGPYKAVKYTEYTYGVESACGVNVGHANGTGRMFFPDMGSAEAAAASYSGL